MSKCQRGQLLQHKSGQKSRKQRTSFVVVSLEFLVVFNGDCNVLIHFLELFIGSDALPHLKGEKTVTSILF